MSARSIKGGALGSVTLDTTKIAAIRERAAKMAGQKRKPKAIQNYREFVSVFYSEILAFQAAGWTDREIVEEFINKEFPNCAPMSIATLADYLYKERVRRANEGETEYRSPTRRLRAGVSAPVAAPTSSAHKKPVYVDNKAADTPAAVATLDTTPVVTPRKPSRPLADDENRALARPVSRDLEDV